MLALLAIAVGPASAQVSNQLKQTLSQTYAGVRFHEVGDRVRAVFGVSMNRGNTPREAAESWLGEYGEIFADGRLELADFRDVARRQGGGRVFMYKQTMDGFDVVGSSARLMVDERQGQSSVLYASARVAVRPEGGLPAPAITARQALAAAQNHATGQRMSAWSEPELVVIYDEAPSPTRGAGEAYPAWKCVGGGGAGGPGGVSIESYSFYVDAITGNVARVYDNIMRFADIRGHVKGTATRADTNANPEILGPDTWDGTATDCPNNPVEIDLGNILVQAFDVESGLLIDSTFTASDGIYTLDVPNGVVVNLEAHLVGPGWEVYKDTFPNQPNLWGDPLEPLDTVYNVTAPNSSPYTDLFLNETPSRLETAYVNAHAQMFKTLNYLDLSYELPSIPLIVNTQMLGAPVAAYWEAGFVYPLYSPPNYDAVPWPGRLSFSPSNDGALPDLAYSTVVSHEFGHYFLDVGLGIGWGQGKAFFEGFADVLAHFVHDTEFIAQDFYGCGLPIRAPLVSNRSYPECSTTSHDRGEVLSAVWLRILTGMRGVYGQSIGWDQTRTLHLKWLPLAQPSGSHLTCTYTWQDQSASPSTLIEVLTADDDDGNLTNGTPHCQIILDAFQKHKIFLPIEIVCGSDGPNGSVLACYADFDSGTGAGTLDIFDFLAFQASFIEGDRSACDCDTSTGTGVCDVFDFLCFQVAFAAGCEKE